MSWLETPIENLAKVGPRNAPRLKRLGIHTVKDLLWHFPSRYEDLSQKMTIEDILARSEELNENKAPVNLVGQIMEIKSTRLWRRRGSITKATIADDTAEIRVVWFNRPYLEDQLKEGTFISLAGKISFDKQGVYLSNPSHEKVSSVEAATIQDSDSLTHTGRLVPIYPETEGVTSKYLRFLIKPLLARCSGIPETLPKELLVKYNLPSIAEAVYCLHFPENLEDTEKARERMAFEELLLFQLRALIDRRQLTTLSAPIIKFDKNLIAEFVSKLPFSLTDDQRLATYEILKDLERKYPMNRLLNGDVGSGKTVVALIAAYQVAKAGKQVVLMAPTEILARQHFEMATKLLDVSVSVAFLTAKDIRLWPMDVTMDNKVSKKTIGQKIARGEVDLIIGTHAVIQKGIKFKNLGLVIIDEQHRFGVKQRMKLVKDQGDIVPHLLSMTATPIPRTLALTIYGDLDISYLKNKPKGRKDITTRVITESGQAMMHDFVRQEIKKGRQVFVICPRIESSKILEEDAKKPVNQMKLAWAEVKSVTDEHKRLAEEVFSDFSVAMLHGKMKPEEKVMIMSNFKSGKYDILVSTSVIEVGVDIPNASIMLIRSADRFGLSQLHQFRGRVGRGEHQSYCLLFTDGADSSKRLAALVKTNNGFELAEADLRLRGPGEFTGFKQSGIPDIAMSYLANIELIKKTRLEARLILQKDPSLRYYPLILKRLSEMQKMVHFE